jgi:hypothetical protein
VRPVDTGAADVSDDGSVVTGVVGAGFGGAVGVSGNSTQKTFRWTEKGMVTLDLLSGTVSSIPTGISGDGSTIVGNAESRSGQERMFVWDEQHGTRDLETVLIEEHGLDSDIFPVADGESLQVISLSSDGTALGGRYGRCCTDNVGWVAFLDRPLVVTTGVAGDFNGNAELDVADLDLLAMELQSERNVDLFDVNSDNMVDFEDRRFWVGELAQTFFGDANLDQEVNFADFLALSNGFGQEGGWREGDFDGDGETKFADFLMLSDNFGKTPGDVATVPEPSSKMLFVLAAGVLTLRTRYGPWAS